MSSEQTFSSDLAEVRIAQDYKRTRDARCKWALGANTDEIGGRAPGKPRPHRPSETEYNSKRRETKGAVASLARVNNFARKHDMLEGAAVTDDSSGSDEYEETPSPPADANITYSFDHRGPSQGSQILNVALNKALQKWEEAETTKLVKTDYEVLDSEGEVIMPTPDKKRKAKGKNVEAAVMIAEDEDYEFV